jgi:hypothetical protein
MTNAGQVHINGKGSLTPAGRHYIAFAMFRRGHEFLKASALLSQHDGYPFVVFHLLCQGLELMLKGLLRASDWTRYNEQFLRKELRHDLVKAAETMITEFRLPPLRPDVLSELVELNRLYNTNQLRYAGLQDLFGGSNGIRTELVVDEALKLLVLGNRCFEEQKRHFT